jgi:hypothetical protein
MKIWSRPYSDMGMTVPNYNRPKVAEAPWQARGAAPLNGDVDECSWLFAGRPGVSERYSSSKKSDDSENPLGVWHDKGHTGRPAGNRGARDPQRPYASRLAMSETKRWSEPCGDTGRSANADPPPQRWRSSSNRPERNSLSGRRTAPWESDLSRKPANNGETPGTTGAIPWEVESHRLFDPVTTEAKAETAFQCRRTNPRTP